MIRKVETYDEQMQNLLDIPVKSIPKYNIQSWQQFKEWIQTKKFIENQLLQTNFYNRKSKIVDKMKQAKYSSIIHKQSVQLSGKQYQTTKINFNQGLALPISSTLQILNDNQKNNSYHGSIRESSAHSSRSRGGYNQINEYQKRESLGKGAFSEVFECIDVQTQKKYAMKVMNNKFLRKKLFKKNSELMASNFINNQIAILKKLSHPYVAKLYQVISDDANNKIYLILQLYQQGFINQSKGKKGQYRKLLQSECKRYYRQLSLALDYIHNIVKIAHRDIKPENILLSNLNQVKLSDFGLSTQSLFTTQRSGTKAYLAPEVEEGNKQYSTQALDIWAFGVTLLVLAYGHLPQLKNQKSVKQSIDGLRKTHSPQMINFLQSCLHPQPSKRITASQLLKHPWLIGQGPQLRNQQQIIQISPIEEEQAIKQKVQQKKKKIRKQSITWKIPV